MIKSVEPKETVVRPKVEAGEPGFALGLAGFITSFVLGIVGLVLSAVALSQSKKIGKRNTFAFAGLIIGIVKTVLDVLVIAGLIFGTVLLVNYCKENPTECTSSTSPGLYGPGKMYNPLDSGDPATNNFTY